MQRQEGEGWRLAWDGQRTPFPLLIGGDGWASELTAAEGRALRQALESLHGQYEALLPTLMEEETLCLEYQGSCPCDLEGSAEGSLWVTLEGDRREWTLRLVLEPTGSLRGLEGSWDRGAARSFLEGLTQLDGLGGAPAPDAP